MEPFLDTANENLQKIGFHMEVSLGFTSHPRSKQEFVHLKFGTKVVITTVSRQRVFEYLDEHGLSDQNAASLIAEIMTDCQRVLSRQTRRERLLSDLVFV